MPRTDFPIETARRILLDWCAAQGMTAVRIRDAGAILPDLAPSLARPRKGPFDWRDGWIVLGTPAGREAAELPLLPGAPLQPAPPRIVAAGPWIDDLLLNLAFRLTGEADRHDLREGWRVPRFRGRPWMAGNGHPCKACGGTGRGAQPRAGGAWGHDVDRALVVSGLRRVGTGARRGQHARHGGRPQLAGADRRLGAGGHPHRLPAPPPGASRAYKGRGTGNDAIGLSWASGRARQR